MTRSEAAALLGVSEDVTIGDLRRQYETLHNDYRIRLTNAPTPALKKTYQQKLQELSTAAGTLHPSFAAAAAHADLPVSEPVLDADLRQESPVTRPAERRAAAPAPPAALPPDGLPRSTMIAAVGAIVLAGALAVVVMQWTSAAGRVAALEDDKAKLTAVATTLQNAAKAGELLMYNGRLRVQNASKSTATIIAASFVYRDAAGTMHVVHSGDDALNYPKWEIRPGGVSQLDTQMGRGRLWDGAIAYYAFIVEYPGVDPFLMAGIWASDVDRDGAVTLDLD